MLAAIQNLLANLAVSFDLPILDWIQATFQNPVLDKVMPIITLFGDGGIFWIAVAVVMLLSGKTRKIGFSMLLALIMGVLVCNVTMKPIIARIRPYDLHADLYADEIKLLVKTPHDWSFPSGHTIASFEACTAIFFYKKSWGIPATILAILIALSRLYLYVHYPTDVIFSFFAGILFGIIGSLIVSAIYRKHPPYEGRYLAQ